MYRSIHPPRASRLSTIDHFTVWEAPSELHPYWSANPAEIAAQGTRTAAKCRPKPKIYEHSGLGDAVWLGILDISVAMQTS
jgi:hypothetical protein